MVGGALLGVYVGAADLERVADERDRAGAELGARAVAPVDVGRVVALILRPAGIAEGGQEERPGVLPLDRRDRRGGGGDRRVGHVDMEGLGLRLAGEVRDGDRDGIAPFLGVAVRLGAQRAGAVEGEGRVRRAVAPRHGHAPGGGVGVGEAPQVDRLGGPFHHVRLVVGRRHRGGIQRGEGESEHVEPGQLDAHVRLCPGRGVGILNPGGRGTGAVVAEPVAEVVLVRRIGRVLVESNEIRGAAVDGEIRRRRGVRIEASHAGCAIAEEVQGFNHSCGRRVPIDLAVERRAACEDLVDFVGGHGLQVVLVGVLRRRPIEVADRRVERDRAVAARGRRAESQRPGEGGPHVDLRVVVDRIFRLVRERGDRGRVVRARLVAHQGVVIVLVVLEEELAAAAPPEPAPFLERDVHGDVIRDEALEGRDRPVNGGLDRRGLGVTRDVAGEGRVNHQRQE